MALYFVDGKFERAFAVYFQGLPMEFILIKEKLRVKILQAVKLP